MSFLQNLDWRFAAKSFDTEKKLSESQLEQIIHSVVMTPTSFGLEPYRVEVVTDQAVLDAIQKSSWNQPQVGTCSHLLVFSARTDVKERIQDYLDVISGGDAQMREGLKGYEDMMNGAFAGKPDEYVMLWAQNQVHIALGFAMAACAELKIDSCAMGGFVPDEVKDILELDDIFMPTVLLPVGFRSAQPERPKVRFGEDEIVVRR